ncbi:MAG: hypothetical protein GY808_04175 [Gammaproteobacteria bacterium]|nr:hypothetical protein [Gammaproteobacteria bacterium]
MVLAIEADGFAEISGSTVENYSPGLIQTGTYDLVFTVRAMSANADYIDRFDITLPADWTIKTLTTPEAETTASCPGVATQTGSDGQKAIWKYQVVIVVAAYAVPGIPARHLAHNTTL